MLVQLENSVVINPETVIFVPIRSDNSLYTVATCSMQKVTEATSREVEVILLMEATAAVTDTLYGKVLRTREWGVVNDSLNYRYGRVLAEKVTGSASGGSELVKWLRAKVESAKDGPAENKIDVMTMLDNLAKDREFFDMTEEGKKIIRDLLLSFIGGGERIKTILERWNDIFVDLPF